MSWGWQERVLLNQRAQGSHLGSVPSSRVALDDSVILREPQFLHLYIRLITACSSGLHGSWQMLNTRVFKSLITLSRLQFPHFHRREVGVNNL